VAGVGFGKKVQGRGKVQSGASASLVSNTERCFTLIAVTSHFHNRQTCLNPVKFLYNARFLAINHHQLRC